MNGGVTDFYRILLDQKRKISVISQEEKNVAGQDVVDITFVVYGLFIVPSLPEVVRLFR